MTQIHSFHPSRRHCITPFFLPSIPVNFYVSLLAWGSTDSRELESVQWPSIQPLHFPSSGALVWSRNNFKYCAFNYLLFFCWSLWSPGFCTRKRETFSGLIVVHQSGKILFPNVHEKLFQFWSLHEKILNTYCFTLPQVDKLYSNSMSNKQQLHVQSLYHSLKQVRILMFCVTIFRLGFAYSWRLKERGKHT